MDFYTVILRQSGEYWVSLCLENGIVAQSETQDGAIAKLKEALESFQIVYKQEPDVHCAPISIKELHEFLALESKEPASEIYQLRAVYA